MFKLCGTVLSCNVQKIKGDRSINQVQLLSNSGKYSRIFSVTDFDLRSWELGKKIEIPCTVTAWKSAKTGNVGLNIVALSATK